MFFKSWALVVCCTLMVAACSPIIVAEDSAASANLSSNQRTMQVLFIGNSYTARHNLAQVVKSMAEAGNPHLTLEPTTVIYGGRTLADHWRLGTQNFVKLHSLTESEERATIETLKDFAKDKSDRYAPAALKKHQALLADLDSQKKRWDVVVLQSYRDDLDGDPSLYAQYAPKFAGLAKAQGARVILYETTPTTQNSKALQEAPDSAPVMSKARAISALANRIDAGVAPMSLVALRCQTERPDLTLRFVNDAHLNQTMAYLTACTLYAAIFDESPVGLPIDSITDIRFYKNEDRSKDRDAKPIRQTFSPTNRGDLQRIAWEGYQQFRRIRSESTAH